MDLGRREEVPDREDEALKHHRVSQVDVGQHQDLAHPINNDLRKIIEDTVLDAFESELNKLGPLPQGRNEPMEAILEEEIRA